MARATAIEESLDALNADDRRRARGAHRHHRRRRHGPAPRRTRTRRRIRRLAVPDVRLRIMRTAARTSARPPTPRSRMRRIIGGSGDHERDATARRVQQRHRWAGFPLAVVYKFGEDQGPYLAALITYYGFLRCSRSSSCWLPFSDSCSRVIPICKDRILDSTLRQFPVIGDELGDPQGLQGSGVALVVGGLVALYGALGVAQALQNAMNIAWAVPRHRRPNPFGCGSAASC